MALLNDIQSYLIANGIGVAPGNNTEWSIYLRGLPDDKTSPDRSIALFALQGEDSEGRWNVVYPRITVYVRGNPHDWGAVETKIQAIFMLLHNTFNEVGADYVSILGRGSEAFDVGKDSKMRPILGRTFNIIKHVT